MQSKPDQRLGLHAYGEKGPVTSNIPRTKFLLLQQHKNVAAMKRFVFET